jgi:hypothetical protein
MNIARFSSHGSMKNILRQFRRRRQNHSLFIHCSFIVSFIHHIADNFIDVLLLVTPSNIPIMDGFIQRESNCCAATGENQMTMDGSSK